MKLFKTSLLTTLLIFTFGILFESVALAQSDPSDSARIRMVQSTKKHKKSKKKSKKHKKNKKKTTHKKKRRSANYS